jgi:hypothetical protein
MSLLAGDKPHIENREGISNPGNTETGERGGGDPNQSQRASERGRSAEKYVALNLPGVVEAEGCHNASASPRDKYLRERFLPAGGKRSGKIILGQLWSELPRTVEAI